jgi:hypothetical protein
MFVRTIRNVAVSCLLTIFVVNLYGCGEETSSFEGFNGIYQLEDDCLIVFAGSSGRAQCQLTDPPDHYFERARSLDVAVQIKSEQVSAQISASKNLVYHEVDGDWTERCEYTIEGVADKVSGLETTGVFATLAGNWRGQVNIVENCSYGSAASGTPTERSSATIWVFDTNVVGTGAVIVYNELGQDQDLQNASVISTPRGVRVNDSDFNEL